MTKENNQGMRDRFKRFYAKLKYDEVGDKYPDEKIADYWINEISLLKKGIEEEIGKMEIEGRQIDSKGKISRELILKDKTLLIVRKAGE